MKVKRIVANIDTRSVDDAKRFYQRIFGLDLLMDHGWIATYGNAEQMDVQISFASEGGSGTLTPICRSRVDDVDDALARVLAAGIPVEYGPADEPWGVRRFCARSVRQAGQRACASLIPKYIAAGCVVPGYAWA